MGIKIKLDLAELKRKNEWADRVTAAKAKIDPEKGGDVIIDGKLVCSVASRKEVEELDAACRNAVLEGRQRIGRTMKDE